MGPKRDNVESEQLNVSKKVKIEELTWMDADLTTKSPTLIPKSCTIKPANYGGQTLGIAFAEGAYHLKEEIKVLGGSERKEYSNISSKIIPFLDSVHKKTNLKWIFHKALTGQVGVFKDASWVLVKVQSDFQITDTVMNDIKVMLEEENKFKIDIQDAIDFTSEDITIISKWLENGLNSPAQSPLKAKK
jgi:hypothetical protein